MLFETLKHNGRQLLIAVDQLLNVLICSVLLPKTKSWADETFSARAWRWYRTGIRWPARIIDTLFFFDKNKDPETGRIIRHCEGSYLSEKYGRQLPPEYR